MKKTALWITIAVAAVITSYMVFAQEQQQGGGMMDRGMMDQRPTPGMAYYNAIAATTDGGVVVLAGNTLIKYDNDLNIVKQTQVETAPEN